MFEAIHGSAPDISGQGIANPSMMLEYIGQGDVAAKVKNAWLKTIEDGTHTGDIYKEGVSKFKVGTKEFADAVIANIGRVPEHFPVQKANVAQRIISKNYQGANVIKKLMGTDVYLSTPNENIDVLATQLESIHEDPKLEAITRKGLKIWPNTKIGRRTCEFVSCRFTAKNDNGVTQKQLNDLLNNIHQSGLEITSMQNIYNYDGMPGFSMPQG